jgi:hypothetical protein
MRRFFTERKLPGVGRNFREETAVTDRFVFWFHADHHTGILVRALSTVNEPSQRSPTLGIHTAAHFQTECSLTEDRNVGVCHVQETTESPLGVNILGPYSSRKDGVTAMCNAYDPGSTDPNKCSAAAPLGVCDHKRSVLTGKVHARPYTSVDAQTSQYQLQACAIKKTLWTNQGGKTATVTGKFLDNCHEPEDEGQVSIYDKSGAQVGTTFKFSRGYPVTVPLEVPSQGHIEYICKSTLRLTNYSA